MQKKGRTLRTFQAELHIPKIIHVRIMSKKVSPSSLGSLAGTLAGALVFWAALWAILWLTGRL